MVVAAIRLANEPRIFTEDLAAASTKDLRRTVSLEDRHDSRQFLLECRDTGSGIADPSAIRVVYLITRCLGRR